MVRKLVFFYFQTLLKKAKVLIRYDYVEST